MTTSGKARWQVIIDRRDPLTGKRNRRVIGTFNTKKEAERAERQALEQRDTGTFVEPDKLTVGDLLDRWLRLKADDVRPQTHAGYERIVRNYLRPVLGAYPVQKLSPLVIQDAYSAWRREGVGAHTVRTCHMLLRQALAHAVRMRLLSVNPCELVDVPKYRPKEKKVWDADELRAFLEVASDDGMSPFWHLLASTGMRRGEALGLRWADVDLERALLTIRQTAVPHNGTMILQDATKTAAGRRTVKLPPSMGMLLREHRVRQLEVRMRSGRWEDHGLVFCTRHGTPYHVEEVRRRFRDLCHVAGVPYITVHGIRHTVATALLGAGVPVKVVSGMLGHATSAITMDLYGHLLSDMQDQAASVMDDLLRQA